MKKLALFLAAVMLLTCCLCFTASAQNGIKVSVVDTEAGLGEEVTVTVAFSDNTGFNTLGVRIAYPEGFVYKDGSAEASDLIKTACYLDFGGYSGATYVFNIDDAARTITLVAASLDDITAASGVLFTATFTAPDAETEGTFAVQVLDDAYNENGEVVEIDRVNGTVTVSSGATYLIGDVNFDEEVDIFDAVDILRYEAGSVEFNATQLIVGDVNNDEEVDIFDAVDVLRFEAGSITEFERS